MKRFESKGGGVPSTRSGPRARAAQDRKFGPARDTNRRDPYQRAERPPRADARPYQGFQQRLRAPASGGIALDPDVARVFRDSESVNEALRLVIRLVRSVGAGARPPFNRTGASGARPRPGYEPRRAPAADRFARNERGTERSLPPRDARFDDSE